jgi:hypothetical protein
VTGQLCLYWMVNTTQMVYNRCIWGRHSRSYISVVFLQINDLHINSMEETEIHSGNRRKQRVQFIIRTKQWRVRNCNPAAGGANDCILNSLAYHFLGNGFPLAEFILLISSSVKPYPLGCLFCLRCIMMRCQWWQRARSVYTHHIISLLYV